jgi:hypothetical protein
MDPYLEDRSLWPDVHSSLISYIREDLQPQVRPKYVARIGERIELAKLHRGYIPDVMIVQPPSSPARSIAPGGVLVADEPWTFRVFDEARRVPYIELIYRESGDVVTVIEVVSPANKRGDGRQHYIRKQNDLLATQVNLVEIDLLGDKPTPTLARTADIDEVREWRYVVSISRLGQRDALEIYAFGIQDRLPRCRIPLRAADPDVVLDLPTVFTRCYDVGGYDLLIDYNREPPVELSEDDAAWLRSHLQKGGAVHRRPDLTDQ